MHAPRDDEQIRRVLRELLVALDVQRVRRRLPHGLVDADDVAAGPTRKMFELVTVERSIGPENGIEMRGWMLKPSSVSSTAMSAQSDACVAQFGFGRSTRRPVSCVESAVV